MPHHSANCLNYPTSQANKARLLVTALVLIGSFSLTELVVGLFSQSLALVADSVHMASDCFALILALLAAWIASWRRSNDLVGGNHPLEVLAALVNGIGLIAIALWIGWKAVEQLQSPSMEILSLPMLATASVGLGVNSVNLLLLHKDSHHDLNIRGVFLHLLADAASSIGVILAAIAVWAMDWLWADGVVSLLVSGLIVASAISLVFQSLQVLQSRRRC